MAMDPDRLAWLDAENALRNRDWAGAAAGYLRFERHQSLAPLAQLRLSQLAQQQGRVREATARALAAYAGAHPDPGLRIEVARQLLATGEEEAAAQALRTAVVHPRVTPVQLAVAAKLFSDHMLPREATAVARAAIARGQDSPGLRYLVGLNAIYLGDAALAREQLEAALALLPGFAPAHWSLCKVGGAERRGQRIDALRRRLSGAAGDDPDRPLLLYSLFHELDAMEDPAAWDALEAATAARRAQVGYDERAQEALHREVMAALAEAPQVTAQPATAGPPGARPLFVVGMPRTGTTLVERELCRATGATSLGEPRDMVAQLRWAAGLAGGSDADAALLQAFPSLDAPALGERYLGHVRWRAPGAALMVDKWPENYLLIPHILRALPDARIVLVRRDPMDACFSNLKEWFGNAYRYSYDQQEVARQYRRFAQVCGAVEALGDPRVALVDYEAFVASPAAVLSGVLGRLGLQAKGEGEGVDQVIATASAHQLRGGISERYVGGWRRYAGRLGPMAAALGGAAA